MERAATPTRVASAAKAPHAAPAYPLTASIALDCSRNASAAWLPIGSILAPDLMIALVGVRYSLSKSFTITDHHFLPRLELRPSAS